MVGATPADSNPCLLRFLRSRHNNSSRRNTLSGLEYTVKCRDSTLLVRSVSVGLGITMTGQLLGTDCPHREGSCNSTESKKDTSTGFEVMAIEEKHNSSDSNLMTADSIQGENGDPTKNRNRANAKKWIRGCNGGRQRPIPGAESECPRTANRSQRYFLPPLLPPIAFADIINRLL